MSIQSVSFTEGKAAPPAPGTSSTSSTQLTGLHTQVSRTNEAARLTHLLVSQHFERLDKENEQLSRANQDLLRSLEQQKERIRALQQRQSSNKTPSAPSKEGDEEEGVLIPIPRATGSLSSSQSPEIIELPDSVLSTLPPSLSGCSRFQKRPFPRDNDTFYYAVTAGFIACDPSSPVTYVNLREQVAAYLRQHIQEETWTSVLATDMGIVPNLGSSALSFQQIDQIVSPIEEGTRPATLLEFRAMAHLFPKITFVVVSQSPLGQISAAFTTPSEAENQTVWLLVNASNPSDVQLLLPWKTDAQVEQEAQVAIATTVAEFNPFANARQKYQNEVVDAFAGQAASAAKELLEIEQRISEIEARKHKLAESREEQLASVSGEQRMFYTCMFDLREEVMSARGDSLKDASNSVQRHLELLHRNIENTSKSHERVYNEEKELIARRVSERLSLRISAEAAKVNELGLRLTSVIAEQRAAHESNARGLAVSMQKVAEAKQAEVKEKAEEQVAKAQEKITQVEIDRDQAKSALTLKDEEIRALREASNAINQANVWNRIAFVFAPNDTFRRLVPPISTSSGSSTASREVDRTQGLEAANKPPVTPDEKKA